MMIRLLKLLIFSSFIATLQSANADSTFAYSCTDEGGKVIELAYHYRDSYILDLVAIDGINLTSRSKLSVTRSGPSVYISNYRHGRDLAISIGSMNGSSYALGSGNDYPLDCKVIDDGRGANPQPNDRL